MRTAGAPAVHFAGRGQDGGLQLHRRLVQPRTPPFRHRLSLTHRLRGKHAQRRRNDLSDKPSTEPGQLQLAHEEAHNQSFNKTVDRFIEQEKAELQRGMLALKRMPAPSAEMAKARWQAGLLTIIAAAKHQLLIEIRATNARIDSDPALAALVEACGGKIRQ